VISDGSVYFVSWAFAASTVYVQQCYAADGSALQTVNQAGLPQGVQPGEFVPAAPVLGQAKFTDGNVKPAIFVNSYDYIEAYSLVDPFLLNYEIAGDNQFTSGLAYDRPTGLVWVGDSIGRLYALDPMSNLQPAAHTPIQPAPPDQIKTTPVLDTDSAGNSYVLFGTLGPNSRQLWIFDPSQPAGAANPASVATGQTAIAQISAAVTNGVIYAAGDTGWNPNNKAAGQVFAINLDRATQALRDFIIESQLLQDFDDRPVGDDTYTGMARYQTHVTIVDDVKAPRAFETVKIWADAPATIAIDGGPPMSIGPGDSEYAQAQAGADGSLTISSGYIQNDGSNDTDVFAVPLRLWASFMDPYERVQVNPDRKFHNRVATVQAITKTTDPGYDSLDVVNLQTAQDYGSTSLFTDQEKTQQPPQPQQIANAVQSMTQAIGLGGSASGRAVSGARTLTDTPGKYLAYDDLPGAAYAPTNTPADRTVTVVHATGFS
jgi:hypothetical protein